jgi:hypothetical protein
MKLAVATRAGEFTGAVGAVEANVSLEVMASIPGSLVLHGLRRRAGWSLFL